MDKNETDLTFAEGSVDGGSVFTFIPTSFDFVHISVVALLVVG